jgi:Rrf2 family iron-sulfur cluster assembly transcriptional regulator
MIFSHSTEYAIRAITFLAQQPAGTLVGAREISRAEKIPMPFLWKILQKLARQRIVRSFKGLHGGYELARPADQITIQAMLDATDGEHDAGRCVLGLSQCDEAASCPLHNQWKEIRGQITNLLAQTTVADLARVDTRSPRRPQ